MQTQSQLLQPMLEEVLKAIGLVVVAGGGLAAITYAIFKQLGERWLNAKFEERLAAYRHEQQKELERLRFKISALLDKATKFHQREFEILPEAWARINDAYWHTQAFISPLQQYPDLNRMSTTRLQEFLMKCELNESERAELESTTDRTSYYVRKVFWHQLAATRNMARESHIYLLKNGIFLEAELRSRFHDLDTLIREALTERELDEVDGQHVAKGPKQTALREGGSVALETLEREVRGRLWGAESSAS